MATYGVWIPNITSRFSSLGVVQSPILTIGLGKLNADNNSNALCTVVELNACSAGFQDSPQRSALRHCIVLSMPI